MSYEIKILVRNNSGAVVGTFDAPRAGVVGIIRLNATRTKNGTGKIELTVSANAGAAESIKFQARLEMWVRNKTLGIDWRNWGMFVVVDYTDIQYSERTREMTFYAYEPMAILDWRSMEHPAGIENYTTFSNLPVETIAKRIVEINAGTGAVTGRNADVNGQIAGLAVAPTAGRGTIITRAYGYGRSLLAVISDLAGIDAGAFTLSPTYSADNILQTGWIFDYIPQMQNDKTATVQFSLERGNMATPSLKHQFSGARKTAIVGADGQGADRYFISVNSPYFLFSDGDIAPQYRLDARQESTPEGLASRGLSDLYQRRPIVALDFEVLQVRDFWLRDYDLLDVVLADYGGSLNKRQITGISVSWSAGNSVGIGVLTNAI